MEKKKYRKQEASSFTKGRHRVQRRLTLYVIVSILFFNFLAIISIIAGSIGLLLALSLAPLMSSRHAGRLLKKAGQMSA